GGGDHLLPLGDLGFDVGREGGRREALGLDADRQQPFLHVGLGDDLPDLALEPVDDLLRGAGRHQHALHGLGLLPSMPSSCRVGTSGKVDDRLVAVTASARSLPSRTSSAAGGIAWNESGVWPATTDWIAGAPPWNGTTTRSSSLNVCLNSSIESDGVVPRPGDAMVYLPGLPLIRSTSSCTDFAGTSGWTSSACVAAPALAVGRKSPF